MKTIDTRELYTRLCELETLRDDAANASAELLAAVEDDSREHEREELSEADDAASDAFGPDEQSELSELETLRDEIGESAMRDGETLIPVDDFEDYAQELASDICDNYREISRQWPFTCIDWEQAAKELAQDYSSVTWQCTEYYFRA